MVLRIAGIAAVVFAIAWSIFALFPADPTRGGSVVINRVSTAEPDWVELLNRTSRDLDLSGFVFSDGDHAFSIPSGTVIRANRSIVLGREKHRSAMEREGVVVNYWWGTGDDGDWGLGKGSREFLLLVNNRGDTIVDFIRTMPLRDGERLERFPPGSAQWYRVRGANRTRVDVIAGALPPDWAEIAKKYPGALAQASLSFMDFLHEFATRLAALLAVVASISYYIAKIRRPEADAARRAGA